MVKQEVLEKFKQEYMNLNLDDLIKKRIITERTITEVIFVRYVNSMVRQGLTLPEAIEKSSELVCVGCKMTARRILKKYPGI